MNTEAGPGSADGGGSAGGLVNPFKGLSYFDSSPQDQTRFGGRDHDIEQVTSDILKSRTYVMYGRSGLGKTSLLLAGIFPDLIVHGCVPLLVRTLENPFEDLKLALMQAANTDERKSNEDLVREISEANDGCMVVIVFDQFEEFFIRFSEEVASGDEDEKSKIKRKLKRRELRQIRDQFIEESGRLANDPELNLRLVWSLREDWVAEMRGFSRVIPDITNDTYRLLPLTAFGVRHSILSLVQVAGVSMDSGLLSELIETLSDYDYDPAVLQVICSEVWKQAFDNNSPEHLTLEHLKAIGGVTGVFNKYLDTVTTEISELGRQTRIQVRAVLSALITDKRTKRALKFGQIMEQGFVITDDQLRTILVMLADNQLIRHDQRCNEDWYELVHERLVEIILGWLGDDQDYFDFRAARNLIRNNCNNPGWEDNPELLLSGAQLERIVGPNKELLSFSEREKQFLLCSAIYSNAPDIQFWVNLATPEVAFDQFNKYLNQQDDSRARAQAGRSIGRAGISPQYFAQRCLELALKDEEDAEVQKACAASFADLATTRQMPMLKAALNTRKTRKLAKRIVVAMVAADNVPSEDGPTRRSLAKARKTLFRERLNDYRDAYRRRSKLGAFSGVIAAVIWTMTAGLIGIWVVVGEMQPQLALDVLSDWSDFKRWSDIFRLNDLWVVFAMLGAFFVGSLALGPLYGWMVARRATRNAVHLDSEGSIFRAMMSPKLIGILLLLLILVTLTISIVLGEVSIFVIQVFGAFLMLIAWCSLIAKLAEPPLLSKRGRHIWLRAWPWAFGGSLILPMFAWFSLVKFDGVLEYLRELYSFGSIQFDFYETLFWFLMLSTFVGGLIIYTSVLAIARSSPNWSINLREDLGLDHSGASPPAVSAPHKWIGVVLSIGVFVLLIQTNGFDSLNYKDVILESENVILEPTFNNDEPGADADHFSIAIGSINSNQPRLLSVEYSDSLRVFSQRDWIDIGGYQESQEKRYLISAPGDTHHMAFRTFGMPDVKQNHFVNIIPDRIAADVSDKDWLSPETDHLFVIPLSNSDKTGMTGQLGRAPGALKTKRTMDLTISRTLHDNDECSGQIYWMAVEDRPAAEKKEPRANHMVTCDVGRKRLDFLTGTRRFQLEDMSFNFDFTLKHQGKVEYLNDRGGAVTSAWFHQSDGAKSVTSDDEILSSSDSGWLTIWKGGKAIALGRHGESINYASFDHNGKKVASASVGGEVKIWDYPSPEHLKICRVGEFCTNLLREESKWTLDHFADNEDRYAIWGVDFNPSPEYSHVLASVTANGFLYLWDTGTGSEIIKPVDLRPEPEGNSKKEMSADRTEKQDYPLYKVNFSPDGTLMVVAAAMGVHLLDGKTGEELKKLGDKLAYAADFSSDGKQILATSETNVYVWQTPLELGAQVGGEDPAFQVLSTGCTVWYATFNPDSDRIAAGCSDGTIHFWDGTEEQGVVKFSKDEVVLDHGPQLAGSRQIWGLSYNSDGTKLLSAASDGNLGIWSFVDSSKQSEDHKLFLFAQMRLSEPDPNEVLNGSN